ncbi:Cytochrome b [Cribrihabitans marinus]|uniref:Cytochrome b n=2 Tax=Cribrihabitans marinus TaxID=1227549 RepID=A0A1H7DA78_9RHOB|nr:cytochrome b/b6 domain-containing protein [Cribrihabitans marinus]SEJ98753.1 Cytochrome b [Cribrihabitans marinus]
MAEQGHRQGERAWDPLVRLTHWTIALAIVLNGFLVDGDALTHIWIGYTAAGLLALRLLWGLIGPENARFSSFPISLSAASRHIAGLTRGEHKEHRSHNPLGALMVYALWAMLLLVSVTGVMLESEPFPEHEGEYSQHDEDDDEDQGAEIIEELHEVSANLLLLLAALHVGGVVLESRLSGRNLVRPMIFGDKS